MNPYTAAALTKAIADYRDQRSPEAYGQSLANVYTMDRQQKAFEQDALYKQQQMDLAKAKQDEIERKYKLSEQQRQDVVNALHRPEPTNLQDVWNGIGQATGDLPAIQSTVFAKLPPERRAYYEYVNSTGLMKPKDILDQAKSEVNVIETREREDATAAKAASDKQTSATKKELRNLYKRFHKITATPQTLTRTTADGRTETAVIPAGTTLANILHLPLMPDDATDENLAEFEKIKDQYTNAVSGALVSDAQDVHGSRSELNVEPPTGNGRTAPLLNPGANNGGNPVKPSPETSAAYSDVPITLPGGDFRGEQGQGGANVVIPWKQTPEDKARMAALDEVARLYGRLTSGGLSLDTRLQAAIDLRTPGNMALLTPKQLAGLNTRQAEIEWALKPENKASKELLGKWQSIENQLMNVDKKEFGRLAASAKKLENSLAALRRKREAGRMTEKDMNDEKSAQSDLARIKATKDALDLKMNRQAADLKTLMDSNPIIFKNKHVDLNGVRYYPPKIGDLHPSVGPAIQGKGSIGKSKAESWD